MKHALVLLAGLVIVAALALSPGQPSALAAHSAQNATPTPAPEAEPTATPAPEVEGAAVEEEAAEPTVADLLARLEALEATVAELYAAHAAAHAATYDQVNGVNTAIYLLDSAGLHDLETRLVEDGEILPGDSGAVGQLARLLSTVAWPDALAEEAATLQEMLAALSVALADDDLETVKPLSTETHVAYHVFSHNAQMWLAAQSESGLAPAPGQAHRVNTAIYLLDGAGLHGLAERLADPGEILPGDSGHIAQVARLLSTVDWPEMLEADALALTDTLVVLATALADDDLDAAAPLADEAHEAQHDLSHHAQMWLSEEAGHDASHDSHSDDAHAEHSHGG